jgi:hypothetical protein
MVNIFNIYTNIQHTRMYGSRRMSQVPINRDWVYLGAGPIWRGGIQDRYPYSACMCLLEGSCIVSFQCLRVWVVESCAPVWGLHVFYATTARNQFHIWTNHLSDLPISFSTGMDGWPLSHFSIKNHRITVGTLCMRSWLTSTWTACAEWARDMCWDTRRTTSLDGLM